MQRLILVLLTSLVLIACGSDEPDAPPMSVPELIEAAGDGWESECQRKMTHSVCLDLRGNKLTTLPPDIGQLTRLKELWLGDNQLTTLPPEIERLSKLEKLDVMDNPLDTASRALVERLKAWGVRV